MKLAALRDSNRFGLGCATLGREIDQAASFDVLDHALETGIRLLDTAEAYGGGQARALRQKTMGIQDVREVSGELHSSELIIGRWLASRRCRGQIVLQTKVLPPLSKQRVLDSIDASLCRLRTDRIDIFLFHAFDSNTPVQESLEALAIARQAGKIDAVGCSNFSAAQLRQALDVARHEVRLPRMQQLQSNYNLAVRELERDLISLCEAEEIAIQTYSPLGAGFLTGKYAPGAPLPPGSRFHIIPGHTRIYFERERFEIVRRLGELSQRLGIPAAELALAWVLKNPHVDCVLIGARTTKQIDQAHRASQLRFEPEWERMLLDEATLTQTTQEPQDA